MEPIYLENWVLKRIEAEAKKNAALRDFLGDKHGELSRIILERFQIYKLRQILDYVYKRSPFYRKLFTDNQILPSEIRSLTDLSKIPFTEPKDIIADPYRFLCVSIGEISRIFTLKSSGTTGDAKRVFFTQKDLHRIVDLLAAHTKTVGGNRKNVIQILLPGTRPFGQADLLAKGVEKAGAIPVITGVTSDPIEQIEAIKKNRSTILVGYPFCIYRVTQEIKQKYSLKDLGIKVVVTTGEHIPLSVRNTIKQIWKADLFSHYGLVEMGLSVGIECEIHKGYHIDEADFIVEIVDPCTGRVLEEGEEGELVITTLSREGMPLIRYRTRDLSRIIKERCECGSILKRIDMITKRIGTAIDLGEVKLYPSTFDESLFSISEIIDYQVDVKREAERVKLIFNVEAAESEITRSMIEKIVSEHPLIQNAVSKGKIEFEIRFLPKRRINVLPYKRSAFLLVSSFTE